MECDTFMPAVDESAFRLWSASPPRAESGLRYSFLCYTRAGSSPARNCSSGSGGSSGDESAAEAGSGGGALQLPPGLPYDHEVRGQGRRQGRAGQGSIP